MNIGLEGDPVSEVLDVSVLINMLPPGKRQIFFHKN